MAKQRHGPNRAETQNKLAQAWLSMGSISVYLSESEHGSPMMKYKKGGKNDTELNSPVYLVSVAVVTECMDADKQHVEYSERNAALLPAVWRGG